LTKHHSQIKLAFLESPIPYDYTPSHLPPPAYGSFEDAYAHWHVADEAKRAIAALDNDPVVAALEVELKEARQALRQMEEKRYRSPRILSTNERSHYPSYSEGLFQALRCKRRNALNVIHPKGPKRAPFFGFRRSKQKVFALEVSDGLGDDAIDQDLSWIRSSTCENNPAMDEFKRTHQAQMEQGIIVQGLEEKVAEHKRQVNCACIFMGIFKLKIDMIEGRTH